MGYPWPDAAVPERPPDRRIPAGVRAWSGPPRATTGRATLVRTTGSGTAVPVSSSGTAARVSDSATAAPTTDSGIAVRVSSSGIAVPTSDSATAGRTTGSGTAVRTTWGQGGRQNLMTTGTRDGTPLAPACSRGTRRQPARRTGGRAPPAPRRHRRWTTGVPSPPGCRSATGSSSCPWSGRYAAGGGPAASTATSAADGCGRPSFGAMDGVVNQRLADRGGSAVGGGAHGAII